MTRVKGSPPRGLSDVVKNDRMLKGRTVLNALFKVWFVLWDRTCTLGIKGMQGCLI